MGVHMHRLVTLLLFSSVALAAQLRQIEPAFKRKVIERHPTGSDKHIVILEPTKEGPTAVQEWELYPSGRIAAAFDVVQKEDGTNQRSGAYLRYTPEGKLAGHLCYRDGKLDGEQVTYDANGVVQTRMTYCLGQQEGKSLTYYPSGEIKEEADFKGGKCVGKAFGYFPNGAVEKQITFVDGVKSGLSELFDKEGKLLTREHYTKGVLSSTGKHHAVEKYDSNGRLLFVQDFKAGKPHGLCMEYDGSGRLRYVVEYVEGKKQGKEEFFGENGMSLGSGLYAHGTPVGEHLRKYPSGQIAYRGKFDAVGLSKEPVREYLEDGTLSKEYVLSPKGFEGEYKEWDAKGVLRVRSHYVHGELDGLQETFGEDGTKTLEAHYKMGKEEGPYRQWRADGSLKFEGKFAGGKLNGLSQAWHENSAQAMKEPYKDGLLEGTVQRFHENGKLKEQSEWNAGKLDGVLRVYAKTGQLLEESEFSGGKFSGARKLYYENGDKKLEARFVNGVIDGPYFEWALGEQLIKSHYFVEGTPHGEQKTYFPGEERRLCAISTFEHGSPRGDHKLWHESGRLIELRSYNAEGEFEGKQLRFDAAGNLLEEAEYKAGKLNGIYRQISPENGYEVRAHYKDDLKHGRSEVLYPKKHALVGAQVAQFTDYVEGQKHGFEKRFTEEGQLLSSIPYVHGKREGIAEVFAKRGEKMMQVTFANDMREGVCLEFYSDGKTKTEVTFIDDKKEGLEKRYHPNGALASERHYKEGLLDGRLREWSPKEILLCEVNYKEGKRGGPFRKFYDDGAVHIEQTFVNDKIDGTKVSYDKKGRATKTEWKMGEKVCQ